VRNHLKKEIIALLKKGYEELRKMDIAPPALMYGEAGTALFNFFYLKYFRCNDCAIALQSQLQSLAEKTLECNQPTLCGGKAGLNWFFTYLYRQQMLDKDEWMYLTSDASNLEHAAITMLETGNYDFLHGAIGIGYQLLYKKNNCTQFYHQFLTLLKELHESSFAKGFPYFDFETEKLSNDKTNMGLAHGLPSVLKFCLECFSQGICRDESKQLAKQLIKFLIANTNMNDSGSYFPYFVQDGMTINTPSRLAWCYGDLGVALILYQAGMCFNDHSLLNFALKVLRHNTTRKKSSEIRVFDAGFCHGSSGIVHIYNKMWKYTRDPLFMEACDYWVKQTLRYAISDENGVIFYKRDPIKNVNEEAWGLLEGFAGIGLTLLSYLTGDFSWDYCLMLND
jgi:lantibiotic biosynthesis protein